jgi:hypothetical protein
MLSRTLTLAAVTLLIGCFATDQVRAQATNLEAGKSPSQIFAGTCTACHKAPRGLLKTVPGSSLQSFLRQHYTTSPEMASLLAAFLISNGAADTRYGAGQPKPGKDEKLEARPGSAPEQLDRFGRRIRPATQEVARPEVDLPRQAAKPDVDGPVSESGRYGRNGRHLARPGEVPAVEGQPAEVVSERGPDGRRLTAKQRLSRRARPGGEEPPKTEGGKGETGTEAAKTEASKPEPSKPEMSKPEPGKEEPAKNEAAKDASQPPMGDTAKTDASKADNSKAESSRSEASKSETFNSETSKSESAKIESGQSGGDAARVEAPKAAGSGEPPASRADPIPPVTPAAVPPTISTAATSAPQPAATPSPTPTAATPAVTDSGPSAVAPAGPPAPPISK